jgi:hypothetical protein
MIPRESSGRGLTIPPKTGDAPEYGYTKGAPPVPTASSADWKRVGEKLTQRRVELDPRYRNRQTFITERGINYRTVSDIERGRRGNYEAATIASVEVAYKVTPGSVGHVLAGGELEPQPVTTSAAEALINGEPDDEAFVLFPDDQVLRWVFRATFLPLTAGQKAGVKTMAEMRRVRRETAAPSGPGGSETGLHFRSRIGNLVCSA